MKKTILIVDEDVMTRLTVFRFLVKDGYNVLGASTAQMAIKDLKCIHCHLVLLAVNMRSMDGMASLSRIRIINKVVPVILLCK